MTAKQMFPVTRWTHSAGLGVQPQEEALDRRAFLATSPANKCHACGATAYAQVIERDAAGVMRPTGMHRCAGCKLMFTSLNEWRTGQPEPTQPHSPGTGPSVTVAPG